MSKATVANFLGNKQVSDVSAAIGAKGTIADRLGINDEVADLNDYELGARESVTYQKAYTEMLKKLGTAVTDYEARILKDNNTADAIKAIKEISGLEFTTKQFNDLTTRKKIQLASDILTKYYDLRIKAFEAQYSEAYRKGAKQYKDAALKASVKKISEDYKP